MMQEELISASRGKDAGIDMPWFVGPRQDSFIRPPQLHNYIIAIKRPAVTRLRSFDAGASIAAAVDLGSAGRMNMLP
jgi:hypothetical protein